MTQARGLVESWFFPGSPRVYYNSECQQNDPVIPPHTPSSPDTTLSQESSLSLLSERLCMALKGDCKYPLKLA